MARSLQEFLNAASSDTIRTNNQWEMTCQTGYPDLDSNEVFGGGQGGLIPLFIQGFNIPARGIEYAPVSFKGYEVGNLVPTRMTMEQEHTVTVLADMDGSFRRAFLKWQSYTMDPDIEAGSVFGGHPDGRGRGYNAQSVIRIHMMDATNAKVNEVYKFFNIRIANVGPITLTYEGGDKATFEVTFKSSFWKIEKATDGHYTEQV